jgi:hypothetical protein
MQDCDRQSGIVSLLARLAPRSIVSRVVVATVDQK